MGDPLGFLTGLWKSIDEGLRAVNKKAKRILALLRFAQVFLILAVIGSWALAGAAWYRPDLAGVFYFAAIVLLSLGLVPWAVLVGLPLRLRSVTRLIDQGYPENARELVIRAVARKMRDESIETEELLFETAVNEGKKAVRKYREHQAREEAAAAAAMHHAHQAPPRRDDP